MLREVFYIADAGVQCRCGDRFAVNLNGAVCDILIPCYGFEQRCFACAVPAEQAINPRLVNRKGNLFQYGCLPVLLCYLFQFYHAAIPPIIVSMDIDFHNLLCYNGL